MKLEDINKKNIYTVPDKYFDQLPARIQSRVNEEKPVSWLRWDWTLTYKLVAPVAAMLLLIFYFGQRPDSGFQNAEAILAEVNTEDLIAYLETTDITTEEIVESLDLYDMDLDLYQEESIIEDLQIEHEELDDLYDAFGLDENML